MNKKWETKKLGEVCELITRGIAPKYNESNGLCILNQKCIRNHMINYEFSRFHDDKIKPINTDKLIQIGDVLVNSTGTGTLGRVAQVRGNPFKAIVDSHITIVRPIKNKFYSVFFGYAMICIEDEIAKRGEGCGGQTELARNILKNEFEIHYPKSLAEQQHIVAILDEAFEDISRAKENTEKNLQNCQDIFRSYLHIVFENSSDGWETKKLYEVCELITRGIAPKYNESNGLCVLNQKCIRNHMINYEFSRLHDDKIKPINTDKLIQNGDVLVNSTGTGTLGRVAQVRENPFKAIVDSHITIVRPMENKFYNVFFGYAMICIEDEIAKRGEGCGGQIELARNTLKNEFEIHYPKSLVEQQHIVSKLDVLYTETKNLKAIYNQKLINLEELKRSILQKAFSGEL